MVINEILIGKFINMRSVNEEDAEFILQLRLDVKNRQFVGATENNISKQVEWIRLQRQREGDYYFMIEDKKGNRVGVISVYNVQDSKAESGRFISFGNSLHNMEAVLMHYDFAYYNLAIELMHYSVYKHNKKVVAMWKRLGSQIMCEEKINNIDSYYFELPKSLYEENFRSRIESTLLRCYEIMNKEGEI